MTVRVVGSVPVFVTLSSVTATLLCGDELALGDPQARSPCGRCDQWLGYCRRSAVTSDERRVGDRDRVHGSGWRRSAARGRPSRCANPSVFALVRVHVQRAPARVEVASRCWTGTAARARGRTSRTSRPPPRRRRRSARACDGRATGSTAPPGPGSRHPRTSGGSGRPSAARPACSPRPRSSPPSRTITSAASNDDTPRRVRVGVPLSMLCAPVGGSSPDEPQGRRPLGRAHGVARVSEHPSWPA